MNMWNFKHPIEKFKNNKSINSVENIFKTFVMKNVIKYKGVPRVYDKNFS
jgi:hypothetical protein